MKHTSIQKLEIQLAEEYLKELFKMAYNQGVNDIQEKHGYPELLTKQDLCKMFQVEMPTVSKLVSLPTFPKFEMVRARYPRDKVLAWIEQNSSWVEQNTNRFGKVI